MKLNWQIGEYGDIKANVPITIPLGGLYRIWITKRPVYCDRGDWLIYVEGHGIGNCLDAADGFPRYFFGSEEEVKTQMEIWASRRSELTSTT